MASSRTVRCDPAVAFLIPHVLELHKPQACRPPLQRRVVSIFAQRLQQPDNHTCPCPGGVRACVRVRAKDPGSWVLLSLWLLAWQIGTDIHTP